MHSGIASAADIDNCVVVSCAGGGKTTKLIDRLMSLLRRGAAPGEILIITFTNKAAAEIRARLLAELEKAARDDSQMAALRRRILLSAAPADALSVHTFHGWFLTLLRHKPGGFFTPPNVCDSVAAVFEESWRRWQRKAEIAPSAALKTVLRELTPAALRKMCEQFREHRAVYEICTPSPSVFSDPESDSSQDEERMRELRFAAGAFAKCFAGGGKTAADVRAAASRLASGETGPAEEKTYFLTAEDSVRSVLAKHAEKIGCVLQLQNIADALIDFFVREEQRRAKEFNSAALEVCEDFSREWDAVLRARNETTFDDLELRVRKMLEGERVYDELSYRLSARYRHILIDEFQDTSPMQWQIVRKWLWDAHGEDAPSVFVVGDPKQAIYGFRGGDSRLLGEAENFLREYYGARTISPADTCYRCGGNILKFVNAVFDEGTLPGFRPHKVGGANAGGRVEWHIHSSATRPPRRSRVRDPLRDIESADEKPARRARTVAAKTAEILREWRLPQKNGETQRCRPGDILILMPQLTHAAALTDALAAENISCAAAGGGDSFLDSFECADILDLIAVLLSPEREYSLARVLKSPLFSLSDDSLAEIAAAEGGSLWEKLRRHPAEHSRRARVLLEFWRRRAETSLLPAHDFLSRLFARGDVFARYRAASPPPMRSRVCENLSRLLDLSLQIAGGARPLLSQFLDEVRRVDRETARTETGVSPSAVRLMSVHAAKGLESPVVILADADFVKAGGRGDPADIFADWPPSAAAPENFVVSLRRCRRAYSELKQKAKEAEERERANLLYVAMTRAERALIIFSSDEPADVAAPAYRAMQQLSSADGEMVFGDSFRAAAAPDANPQPPAAAQTKRIGERETKTAAAVRGEIRHRVAALLISGIPPEIARKLVAAEDAQWREAETIASSPPLQKLLQNAAEVLVERDFCIGGEVLRPDLIVVRDDAVWIVDYKTGDANPARHRPQLENYRRAVAARYSALPIRLAILDIHGRMHCLDSE